MLNKWVVETCDETELMWILCQSLNFALATKYRDQCRLAPFGLQAWLPMTTHPSGIIN